MTHPGELEFPSGPWLEILVQRSLAEDVGPGDVSTELSVAADAVATGEVVSRGQGVVAGLPLMKMVYVALDERVAVEAVAHDGDVLRPGQVVARLSGPAGSILTGERTALNFLQHLSGIASATARYVAAVDGTGCRVLDTRKTLPGYRELAKYAVRAGGGHNHRMALYDRIMLKDNHWLTATTDMPALVAAARREHPDLAIEIEVDDLEQLDRILPLQVDWILLDNFQPEHVVEAVLRRDRSEAGKRTLLEASGNLNLDNVRDYAEAGVDAVSIGRLTHSSPALDLGLELEPAGAGGGES